MKLTEEILHAKMRRHLERAKQELSKCKPSDDPDIAPLEHLAVAVWNTGIEKEYPGRWTGKQQKEVWGYAISKACELTHASAVILRCIGTGVKYTEIVKELKVDLSVIGVDEYQKRLMEWVETTTGQRLLSGLPERFRVDYIIIFAMGPKFKETGIIQPYEWKDGAWQFPPWDLPNGAEMHSAVIPKWWQ